MVVDRNVAHRQSSAITLDALDDRPTAICCFCDSIAMGVYEAAKEAGLSIPRDISVIGF
ncbi:substrate-binding domain-containing protein, partial [Rhizobium leguminosarum]|uniref:substrate-binding domain-containing protein n=1 Tax=Rhizobium leguminosarum TaxID=384 RepID=UPI003F94F60D